MKKIIVSHWRKQNLLPYFAKNTVFDYSIVKQREIIETIITSGFSVMIRPNMGENKDTLLIYIDDGRFGQS